MKLPWSISCVRARSRARNACQCERQISGWVYVCVRVGVWEAVIWCMGVGVKADRMRIVIIPVLIILVLSV